MPPRLSSMLFVPLAMMLTAPAEAAAPGASPYAELAALEARVAAIGFRLTTANAPWCPALQPQFGWIWGDAALYRDDDRAPARAAYGARAIDAPFLAAVVAGGPAATAGLKVGDPLLAIPGGAIPPLGPDPFSRIDGVETGFSARPPDRPMRLGIEPGQTIEIIPVAGCASDFRVEASDRAAGGADGRVVRISAGLARLAADDAELATVVAHELAHNILRHPARLDAAGVDRGLLRQFGRNARLIRQTEVEADRLSVWLLAAAGYDPEAAVRFWEAYQKHKGPVLFQPGTHPRAKARVASLQKEIASLRAAQAARTPLFPPLIAAPPPLE